MTGPPSPDERTSDQIGNSGEESQSVRHPFEGRLVRLREPRDDDEPRLNEMFGDPEVLAGITLAFPQPVSQSRAWVQAQRGDDSSVIFVIETLEGQAVGRCDLRELGMRNRSAGMGLWIGKPYWGRGLGTDAVRTLCRFAFRHMNLQRIELHVYADNLRGIRAYEKVGFQVEGTLRRAQFVGGRYVDVLVMGLLEDEFIDA